MEVNSFEVTVVQNYWTTLDTVFGKLISIIWKRFTTTGIVFWIKYWPLELTFQVKLIFEIFKYNFIIVILRMGRVDEEVKRGRSSGAGVGMQSMHRFNPCSAIFFFLYLSICESHSILERPRQIHCRVTHLLTPCNNQQYTFIPL